MDLYNLSNRMPISSLSSFADIREEYAAAFADFEAPFLYCWSLGEGRLHRRDYSRGEFWRLALNAAGLYRDLGLQRGDRVIHGFSGNSPDDLLFRLAGTMTGSVPVTINWQADDRERLSAKVSLTGARLFLYDRGMEKHAAALRQDHPDLLLFPAGELPAAEKDGSAEKNSLEKAALGCGASGAVSPDTYRPALDDEKMVIFTSGTTGVPKGVSLSHRNYLANRLTFEGYFHLEKDEALDLLLVNPLHHANSSALADWGMRRAGAVIHLVERYSTLYWQALTAAAEMKRGRLVTALVATHLDFLDNLHQEGLLPVEPKRLRLALEQTEVMLGSAPVGPKTIANMQKYAGHLPLVRFGSTETCLQVLATPTEMSEEYRLAAFEAGWNHEYRGEKLPGYYIGREHYPITRLLIVKAIDPAETGFMTPCEVGQPGYLVTQGANLMTGYVADPEATRSVFREGWYTGLRDIAFTRFGKDGELDYYWQTRDSAMLIRGGANYSYAQVAAELSRAISEEMNLAAEDFQVAVVGLKITSEHDDNCCVTVELSDRAAPRAEAIKEFLLTKAAAKVGKGSRPDFVLIAPIPRSFKGEIMYGELKKEFTRGLNSGR